VGKCLVHTEKSSRRHIRKCSFSKRLEIARSPDLTSCNFFLWGTMNKEIVDKVEDMDQLRYKILDAADKIIAERFSL
jgi:hypothetical protein